MERIPPPMDADMRAFARWIGSASPGAHVVEEPGVVAAVVPAVPERSVFNSVVYDDAGALRAALPRLARVYDEAGVRAWTVWVPDGDRATAELLARSGHALDAEPAAMLCRLSELQPPESGDLDWSADGRLADLAAINDAAYGHPEPTFARALTSADDAARIYVADDGGRPVCGLSTLEMGASAGVYWVATIPEARGRRLAGRLLGVALAAARERGCEVATLQATRAGAPVYASLGFRGAGALQMWERRRA